MISEENNRMVNSKLLRKRVPGIVHLQGSDEKTLCGQDKRWDTKVSLRETNCAGCKREKELNVREE